MEKTLFSVSEAAEYCKKSRMTISRWIKTGKIKAENVGRTKIISITELAKCTQEMPSDRRAEIESAVKKVVREYEETLKLLAKE